MEMRIPSGAGTTLIIGVKVTVDQEAWPLCNQYLGGGGDIDE